MFSPQAGQTLSPGTEIRWWFARRISRLEREVLRLGTATVLLL